jgi:hypothetical protein
MFRKLQKSWGLSAINVLLSLCTFAIGGSLCGYVSRLLLKWMDVPGGILWWLVYILILTITWPISVLLISLPLGQFAFFRSYLIRLARKMGFGKARNEQSKSAKQPEAMDSV